MTEEEYNINNVTLIGRTTKDVFELHQELQRELYSTGRRIQEDFKGKAVIARTQVRVPAKLSDAQIFSIDRQNIPLSELESGDSILIVYGDYGLYGRLACESKPTRSGMEWRRIEAMWRFLHDHCGCVMAQDIAKRCASETESSYGFSERYLEAAVCRLINGFERYLEKGDLKDQAAQITGALKGYARENFYLENERNIELFNEDAIRRIAEKTVLLVAVDREFREGRKSGIRKRLYMVTVQSDRPEEIQLPEIKKESLLERLKKKAGARFRHPFERKEIDERQYQRVAEALRENLPALRGQYPIRVIVTPPRPDEVLYYSAKALPENDFISKVYVSPIEETMPAEWFKFK